MEHSGTGFFFLKALPDGGRVQLLAGRWWKLAYDQIHDNNRTKAQSAKAFKKGFMGFVQNSVISAISV